MAEIWGAAIAVVGAVGGAAMSADAAKKAGKASAAGSAEAIAEQRRQYDLSRLDSAPYRNIGAGALALLGSPYGLSTGAAPTNRLLPGPGGSGGVPMSEQLAGGAPITNQLIPAGTGEMRFDQTPGLRLGLFGQSPEAAKAFSDMNLGGKAIQGIFGADSTVGKLADPVQALFGSKKGDEKRNLAAFAAESGVMQLPDGRFALPDGTIFGQDRLEQVAGTWYGATKAPDGDQAGWQAKFNELKAGLQGQASPGGYRDPVTIDATQDGSGRWIPTPGGGVEQRMTVGGGSLDTITGGANGSGAGAPSPDYSNFFASPDFGFRRQEGDRAITRNAAAMGGLASGNTGAALVERSSDLASGEYGNYFNRLATLAGLGNSAVTTSTAAGMQTASNIGNAQMNAADARASGIATGADAWGNALGTVAGVGYNYFNRPRTPSRVNGPAGWIG
jgi:hypothetical protein